MALTLRTVNAQKPKATRYVIRDGKASGCGPRVIPKGERAYVLNYRSRHRWMASGWSPTLGLYLRPLEIAPRVRLSRHTTRLASTHSPYASSRP